MKFRGFYLKVTDMKKAVAFWQAFLDVYPTQITKDYFEFVLDNGVLGLSLNNYGDKYQPSNAVPVFQMDETKAQDALKKVLGLGAKLVYNGINVAAQKCIVCADPCGNEFEFNALIPIG